MSVSEDQLDRLLSSGDPLESILLGDDQVDRALGRLLRSILTTADSETATPLPGEAPFATLYRQTSLDLLAFLLRRCDSVQQASACLIDTYLIARRLRGGLPVCLDARPWLLGIARNLLQGRRDQQPAPVAAAAGELARALDVAPIRSRSGATGDAQSTIAGALSALSRRDREIVTLVTWDGLDTREVASVLGLSANVVKVRIHRARAKLRRELDAPSARVLAPVS